MAYVINDDCIACGTCIDECPVGAISEGDKYSIDPDACTECFLLYARFRLIGLIAQISTYIPAFFTIFPI